MNNDWGKDIAVVAGYLLLLIVLGIVAAALS
jgi:hypothetical protein